MKERIIAVLTAFVCAVSVAIGYGLVVFSLTRPLVVMGWLLLVGGVLILSLSLRRLRMVYGEWVRERQVLGIYFVVGGGLALIVLMALGSLIPLRIGPLIGVLFAGIGVIGISLLMPARFRP